MRNITTWGSGVKAKRLLEDPPFGASMIGFLETHTRSEDVDQQLDILASCGWKGVATPSRQDLKGPQRWRSGRGGAVFPQEPLVPSPCCAG